jgi:glycerol kinase
MPSLGSIGARSLDRDEPRDSRADLCRAVLEGIAFRASELIAAFNSVAPCTKIVIDGGLTRSRYFCEFLADAIGSEVMIAETADVTLIGLLQLAGIGTSVPAPATEVAYRRVTPAGILHDKDRDCFAEALRRASGWTARISVDAIATQAAQTEEASEW